jgi:type IV pilus assembly protein PilM
VIERYETAGSEKVTKIVLAGGGAVLKGLRETLESALGVPVVLSNPFTKVEYPAFLEATLKEIGPSFAVAMGAALRRLAEK